MNILGATSGLNSSLGSSSSLAGHSSSKPDSKNAFSDSLGLKESLKSDRKPAEKSKQSESPNQNLSASSSRSPLPPKAGPQGPQTKREEPQAPVQSKPQFYSPEAPQVGATEKELDKNITLHNFMKRMQDELGVKVDDVLVAFASLTVADLAKPPIQNVDKLTDALPITQAQEPLAKNIFLEMINNSEANYVSEQMGPASQQLSLQLLSKQDAQKAALKTSLDQMQKDFFVDPKAIHPLSANQSPQTHSELGLLNEKNQKLSVLDQSSTNQFFKNEDLLSQAAGLDNPMAQSTEELPRELISSQSQNLDLQTQSESDDDSASIFPSKILAAATLATAAATKSVKPSSSINPDEVLESSFENDTPELEGESDPFKALAESLKKQGEAANSNPQNQTSGQSQDLGMDAEIEPFSAEGGTEAFAANSGAAVSKNEAAATLATPMFAQGLASPADQEANVKEVAEKTQMLIDKGGGQMKVTLRPDGMGELTMKVAVKNGQVAVEMVTETNEAKRFLEKGLGDLRSSLMSHKLEVEHIKVDTASDISKQMDQKQDDSNRQAAHQFMEQFRQENQAWRRNFFDLPGAKGYKSQTKDEADNAILAAQSSRGSGDRKRLDLVA